jgi:Protein of unknown function (DUF1592)./Protein of unknown function (DUF1595).
LYLPEGDHTFRVGFINDDFVKLKGYTGKDAYNSKTNKYIDSITFVGPILRLWKRRAGRKSWCAIRTPRGRLGARASSGLFRTLAHRAYRRPVTKSEVAGLVKFVSIARAQGQSVEQGIQLAIEAMLVSPHFLFRVEHDPKTAAAVHRITDVELASRLSYFLWSSMPDDELLGWRKAASCERRKS